MKQIKVDLPFFDPPEWALLERQLIDLMNEAVDPLVERYIHPDGRIKWPTTDNHTGIDALDDTYESFFNWPLFYVIGGHEKFRELSLKEFDAITKQFASYDSGTGHKMVEKEYEQGYDWFHQGEGYTFFYHMALMDPSHEVNKNRAIRYAGFFLNEDPEAINFDKEHNIIPYPHSGSKGATDRNFKQHFVRWSYSDWMKYYGLHFQDIEGVSKLEDLKDDENARRMGEAIVERMSRGDVPLNLLATSMVVNAYLHTGDSKYKVWLKAYVDAWIKRTQENNGIVPDNIGLNGIVGEHNGGKWYGGWYGWTWPHGWLSIGQGVSVAAENALLLERNTDYMEFLRSQIVALDALAVESEGTRFVPYKYGDDGWYGYEMQFENVLYEDNSRAAAFKKENKNVLRKEGWFEFQPMEACYPTHLWYMSMENSDKSLLKKLRNYADPDWEQIRYLRAKDQGGHEYAWVSYLEGNYPSYPTEILKFNLSQVYHRLDFMKTDTENPAQYKDDYLQIRNPITLEGLLQLTLGAPSPLYNGGHLMARLRYYDADNKRPGLPPDVASLVEELENERTVVRLVNLHPTKSRRVILQAGAFGEHQFTCVQYTVRGAANEKDSLELGGSTTMEKLPSGFQQPAVSIQTQQIDGKWLLVELEPGCHSTLDLATRRFANDPSYDEPWAELH
ncbi:hypothetical protein EHS13_09080 [Paenibacillus psychroresistens]|uniref:Uncharacterized protein n=1 Tax=Paenibacillus psychroresistens TaxID=1778678 RepID=A0A6B8RGG1_9BACL|nr:hypothetical protein [Paenibacillus psychroresistens]QGQ95027.1 hypothetical protein EHS13_09080 [Paenibacillus psychroresistens]